MSLAANPRWRPLLEALRGSDPGRAVDAVLDYVRKQRGPRVHVYRIVRANGCALLVTGELAGVEPLLGRFASRGVQRTSRAWFRATEICSEGEWFGFTLAGVLEIEDLGELGELPGPEGGAGPGRARSSAASGDGSASVRGSS